MSSLAIPLPKPSAGRPPFGGPPTKTAFDGGSDEHRDPIHRVISDSVQQVLNACKNVDIEDAPLVLRLIEQRKKAVERELAMLRLLGSKPMPPLISNFYALDFMSDDSDVERIYVRLLEDLDSAASKILCMLDEQNGEPATS